MISHVIRNTHVLRADVGVDFVRRYEARVLAWRLYGAVGLQCGIRVIVRGHHR